MALLSILFPEKKKSATAAKERLQIIIARERTNRAGPDFLPALHQELIGLRRRHRWLHRARTTQLHLTNTALVYRTAADGEALVVALNLADAPAVAPASGTVLAGQATPRGRGLELPAHGWAVLSA